MRTQETEGATESDALDVRAAAAVLGTSEKAIRQRIARGQLPYRRLGGRIVLLRSELRAYLTALDGVSVEDALEAVQRIDTNG